MSTAPVYDNSTMMRSDAAWLAPSWLVRQTSIDRAVHDYKQQAEQTVKELESLETKASTLERPMTLERCIFVGHTATDLDSIGSAIGASELFGGVAARASDINTETEWALKNFDIAVPAPFLDVPDRKKLGVCLVDHNQTSQMTSGIEPKQVRGIIDHHALQSGTVQTDSPIYVNIRPWGSACTIVAHMFLQQKRAISKKAASALLCGILSDTLNLNSPTTTDVDKMITSILATIAGVKDCNALAQQLFKAKSKMANSLSAHQLLRGDLKIFNFKSAWAAAIAFGVVETTDPDAVLSRRGELLIELKAFRTEQKVNLAYLAVVDIVKMTSTLLIAGAAEGALAEKVFGGTVSSSSNTLDLGKRVSRKKDYIPPLTDVVSSGWQPEKKVLEQKDEEEDFGEIVTECTEFGCQVKRKYNPKVKGRFHATLALAFFSKDPLKDEVKAGGSGSGASSSAGVSGSSSSSGGSSGGSGGHGHAHGPGDTHHHH